MESTVEIEYVTVSQFLRRLRNEKPWGFQNVAKFGGQLNKIADGFGMTFQSAVDPTLGPLRVYPVALVAKIYAEMAPQLGWPRIIEALPVPQAKPSDQAARAELELKDGMVKHLRMLASASQDTQVRSSAQVLLGTMEREVRALQRELGAHIEAAATED
jgi:hypothetical protein